MNCTLKLCDIRTSKSCSSIINNSSVMQTEQCTSQVNYFTKKQKTKTECLHLEVVHKEFGSAMLMENDNPFLNAAKILHFLTLRINVAHQFDLTFISEKFQLSQWHLFVSHFNISLIFLFLCLKLNINKNRIIWMQIFLITSSFYSHYFHYPFLCLSHKFCPHFTIIPCLQFTSNSLSRSTSKRKFVPVNCLLLIWFTHKQIFVLDKPAMEDKCARWYGFWMEAIQWNHYKKCNECKPSVHPVFQEIFFIKTKNELSKYPWGTALTHI